MDVTTGLRRSELFALKWSDIDIWNLTIDIRRSIFQGVVGNCKTAASRRPVPLSLDVAADLWPGKAQPTPEQIAANRAAQMLAQQRCGAFVLHFFSKLMSWRLLLLAVQSGLTLSPQLT